MAAVDHGLTSGAGPDIAKACLELVASLAAHVCTDPTLHGAMAYHVGAHFLEVLLCCFLFFWCFYKTVIVCEYRDRNVHI